MSLILCTSLASKEKISDSKTFLNVAVGKIRKENRLQFCIQGCAAVYI